MILDFSTQETLSYEADLCIIGGGIATYTLLSSLAHRSMRVMVIERGGMEADADQDKSKACEVTGHSFAGHLTGRYFGLGGTSEYWGGQALPLQDFDLSRKSWVDFSGWPIPMNDITPFFADAEKLFQVNPVAYDSDVFQLRSLASIPWDQSAIQAHFSKWSPRPNFKPNLVHAYSNHPQVDILINAVTTSLEYSEDTKEVSSINIHYRGKVGNVRAKRFILAAGGIENARLLLVSPTLPVNEYIGRMFQDHPTAQVATIHPADNHTLQRYFNYFFKGKTRCLPRLSLTSAFQEKHKTLAATAFIQFIPREGSVLDSFKQVYRAISRFKMPSGKAIADQFKSLRHIGEVIPIARAYLFGRHLYTPDGTPRLTFMIEQAPIADSYIALSNTDDENGMPVAKIHWQFSDATIDTFRAFCTLLESEFSRLRLGRIEWDAWVMEGTTTVREHLTDAYHHMGTTRMSETAATGVVDQHCKVHGVDNLYIAGSSVFPTSGHSNPTLTFMALALRLGHHLSSHPGPKT